MIPNERQEDIEWWNRQIAKYRDRHRRALVRKWVVISIIIIAAAILIRIAR
jgi:hypothetical protein